MDWVTISALATAGGTLVLAVATYGSVRSANRAARVAEQSLLAQVRPLLMTSRWNDPVQKVGFADDKWLHVEGGRGAAEATSEAVYLAISVRARRAIENRTRIGVDVLYGDELGGQRVITRFALTPREDAGWLASVSRHRHVDAQAPR